MRVWGSGGTDTQLRTHSPTHPIQIINLPVVGDDNKVFGAAGDDLFLCQTTTEGERERGREDE